MLGWGLPDDEPTEYTLAVNRILAILLLISAGWPALGSAGAGVVVHHHAECGGSECATVVIEPSCCDEPAPEPYCPASSGPCGCDMTPDEAPVQDPNAPLPRTQRDTVTAIPAPTPQAFGSFSEAPEPASVCFLQPGVFAGLTNNQIQSLLGRWRT